MFFLSCSVWHSGSGFQAGTSGGCAGAELYFQQSVCILGKREGTGKSGKTQLLHPRFAIPALTIALAFAVNQVFPFGDHGVLIIDSLHQYLPFFTEFHEKLEQGSSLRYSFGGGLGFNFWATYAYYLASPLNFLIVLFPKRNMMDAMHF